ncbi:MAG: hypothetical protein QM820_32355 [Minicystis sp.]
MSSIVARSWFDSISFSRTFASTLAFSELGGAPRRLHLDIRPRRPEPRVLLPLLVERVERLGDALGERLVLGEQARHRDAEGAVLFDQPRLGVAPVDVRPLPLPSDGLGDARRGLLVRRRRRRQRARALALGLRGPLLGSDGPRLGRAAIGRRLGLAPLGGRHTGGSGAKLGHLLHRQAEVTRGDVGKVAFTRIHDSNPSAFAASVEIAHHQQCC